MRHKEIVIGISGASTVAAGFVDDRNKENSSYDGTAR